MNTYTISFEIRDWAERKPWQHKNSQTRANSEAEAIANIKERGLGWRMRNFTVKKVSK